jgi:hypothetical protein
MYDSYGKPDIRRLQEAQAAVEATEVNAPSIDINRVLMILTGSAVMVTWLMSVII